MRNSMVREKPLSRSAMGLTSSSWSVSGSSRNRASPASSNSAWARPSMAKVLMLGTASGVRGGAGERRSARARRRRRVTLDDTASEEVCLYGIAGNLLLCRLRLSAAPGQPLSRKRRTPKRPGAAHFGRSNKRASDRVQPAARHQVSSSQGAAAPASLLPGEGVLQGILFEAERHYAVGGVLVQSAEENAVQRRAGRGPQQDVQHAQADDGAAQHRRRGAERAAD